MDRVERDREALLDTALQQWADGGWPAVDPVAAAERAGVAGPRTGEMGTGETGTGETGTGEFGTGTDLACAVFDHVVDERAAATLSAVREAAPTVPARVRAALTAIVDDVARDPRRVITLVDAVGNPELVARRRSANRGFAELVVSQNADTRIEPDDLRVAGHFCIGGLTEMVLAWLDPASPVDREQVLGHGVRLYEACLSTR